MKDFRNSPIIKAQELCKETVVKIGNAKLSRMYQSAVEDLTINDYEVDMEPWNNGYELTIKPKFDFSSIKGDFSFMIVSDSSFNHPRSSKKISAKTKHHLKSVSPSVDGSQLINVNPSTEKSRLTTRKY